MTESREVDESDEAARQRQVFFEVHRDLPREGPGNRASTARALALVSQRRPAARIGTVLDVGCGPGQQTLDLAELLPAARIVAVDLHHRYVAEARRRITAARVDDRVLPLRGDMTRLPLAPASVDLVWCEGAAYIMGVAEALAVWRELLRSGGCVAFTEPVWLRDDPLPEVRDFWAAYPAMAGCAEVVAAMARTGLQPAAPFVLPAQAWWDDYYRPMAARLDRLTARYRDDPVARGVLAACRAEIDLYRRHGDCYGYGFFVGQWRP